MRANPAPSSPTTRHHQLKGLLSIAAHRGVVLTQWQYEVTAGGRVWYLVDLVGKKVYRTYAGTRHPKATE
ncbi:hypothetical protein ACFY36_21900 [Actinoplanes sp. NPDC000266]